MHYRKQKEYSREKIFPKWTAKKVQQKCLHEQIWWIQWTVRKVNKCHHSLVKIHKCGKWTDAYGSGTFQ